MTYLVKLHPNVVRFLKKCDKLLSTRVKNKLRLLQDQPFVFLEHFEGKDLYKLRIGDYRALIDVDNSRKIVFVRVIGHRKKIYKKL